MAADDWEPLTLLLVAHQRTWSGNDAVVGVHPLLFEGIFHRLFSLSHFSHVWHYCYCFVGTTRLQLRVPGIVWLALLIGGTFRRRMCSSLCLRNRRNLGIDRIAITRLTEWTSVTLTRGRRRPRPAQSIPLGGTFHQRPARPHAPSVPRLWIPFSCQSVG